MTFKKIMSAVMAGAMALSLGMTAFAAATPGQTELEGEQGYEIEVGSSTQAATIKVQVPDAVGFIVNPYRLEAKNEEIGITSAAQTQVVSPLQKIVNKSAFKISIGGTIYAYANNPEEAKLVKTLTTPAPGTPTPKEAAISFLAKADVETATTALKVSDTVGTKVELADAATDTGAALTAVELAAAGTTGGNTAYTFNFDGTAQDAPAVAWTEGDTYGATIAFTFTAVANAATP